MERSIIMEAIFYKKVAACLIYSYVIILDFIEYWYKYNFTIIIFCR